MNEKIKIVSRRKLNKLASEWRARGKDAPRGLYLASKKVCTTVDNSTGDFCVRTFGSLWKAIEWLKTGGEG